VTRHKRSMDLPLVGGESLFDNGFFLVKWRHRWNMLLVSNPMYIKFIAS
jgi:hypothetical protein